MRDFSSRTPSGRLIVYRDSGAAMRRRQRRLRSWWRYRAAVDRSGPGHVPAPRRTASEDGHGGGGERERAELHGDDPGDPPPQPELFDLSFDEEPGGARPDRLVGVRPQERVLWFFFFFSGQDFTAFGGGGLLGFFPGQSLQLHVAVEVFKVFPQDRVLQGVLVVVLKGLPAEQGSTALGGADHLGFFPGPSSTAFGKSPVHSDTGQHYIRAGLGPRTSRLPRQRERLHMAEHVRGCGAYSRVACLWFVREQQAHWVDWRLLGCVALSVAEAGRRGAGRWRGCGGWESGGGGEIFFFFQGAGRGSS